MGEIITAAILHEQMSADEIWQTRAIPNTVMPAYWSARFELNPMKHASDFFQRRTELKGQGSHPGQHVKQGDNFSRAAFAFDSEE